MQSGDRIIFDSEVAPEVMSIFDDAQQYVVVVSPWIDLWGHVRNAITKAQSRGLTNIRFIIRKDGDPGAGHKRSVAWLLNHNVKVFEVERLHAKVYFNEKSVLLSSMNLMESSALNSVEVAYLVTNKVNQFSIRNWVTEDVMQIASEVGINSSAVPRTPPRSEPMRHASATEVGAVQQRTVESVGYCISCRDHISLNPMDPLCRYCDDSHETPPVRAYLGSFCHTCGESASTAWFDPMCEICSRKWRAPDESADAQMANTTHSEDDFTWFCINCARTTGLGPSDMLCPSCRAKQKYASYEDSHLGFCHSCAKLAYVSLGEPVCPGCSGKWQVVQRRNP